MKTENDYQFELFSSHKNYSAKKSPPRPFFTYIRGYEKAVLIIIGIFVASVISFSAGVEKGKRVALSKLDLTQAEKPAAIENKIIPQSAAPLQAPQPQRLPIVVTREMPKVLLQPQKAASGAYTVQLASFKARTEAQREADKLKKKGLIPVILAKGKYLILCVGNFSSKEPAKQLVLQLQKRYKDCYVRRL